MPGDPTKVENKKDMLMAFLYACFGARALQTYFAQPQELEEPVAYGTVFQF